MCSFSYVVRRSLAAALLCAALLQGQDQSAARSAVLLDVHELPAQNPTGEPDPSCPELPVGKNLIS
jgi:hypothetical protein